MNERSWVAVASAEHVRLGRAQGFMQVCHGKAAALRRLTPADRVAYYSPPELFGGKEKLQAFEFSSVRMFGAARIGILLKWTFRFAGARVTLIILAVVGAWTMLGGRDPLDRFEVIAVDGPSMAGEYAITCRHYHADSSCTIFSTWLQSQHPAIGASEPPLSRARPIVVATGSSVVVNLHWQSDKLLVVVHNGTQMRNNPNECYFQYEKSNMACVDPNFVTATVGR